jgi:hypothetical protein
MDTNPSKQRQQFYRDRTSGQWSMSKVCDWSIVYYNTILGRIDLQTGKVTGNEKCKGFAR